jgi:DNA-binding MarR family transcriptional regulator
MCLLHIKFKCYQFYTSTMYVNGTVLKSVSDILGILSKQDALKIFLTCVEGIEADTDAAERLGLTKKQYYTRLKQLVDYGLIEKRHGKYVHTTLGKTIHDKTLRMLFEHVRNSKKLMMLDILKSSGKFDVDEIYRLLQINDEYKKHDIMLIMGYDRLMREVIDRLEYYKERSGKVYYATHSINNDIISKLLELKDKSKSKSKDIEIILLIDKSIIDLHSDMIKDIGRELRVTTGEIPFNTVLFVNDKDDIVFIELASVGKSAISLVVRNENFVRDVRLLLESIGVRGVGFEPTNP